MTSDVTMMIVNDFLFFKIYALILFKRDTELLFKARNNKHGPLEFFFHGRYILDLFKLCAHTAAKLNGDWKLQVSLINSFSLFYFESARTSIRFFDKY